MSYGVLGSRAGHLLVETLRGAGTSRSDAALQAFLLARGPVWVQGRLTLTALHATFVPHRVGAGAGTLTLDLADVVGVELGGGVVQRSVGLRTASHVARFRCLGALALAEQAARAVGAARRTARKR
ncbi:hypothetical protein GCM10027270_26610 [Nocardioides ginkgobilobae]|uniref:Unannotated protein n=1 Tax=freshwater metagenome TaxID=449393 RepID=A0A6J6TXG9_9ZZZZ|nr:hypothetical protein [Actinomycetota bacterium]